MKKNLLFSIIALIMSIFSYGQYSDVKYFNSSQLIFDTLQGYDLVYFEGCGFTDEIGYPMIPTLIYQYLIPLDSKFDSITIINKTKQQISGKYYIFPTQEPIIMDGRPAPDFVYPIDSVYNSDNPYPGKDLELIMDGNYMGNHIITLKINPIEYIPHDSLLNLITSIEFLISYTTSNSSFEIPLRLSLRRNEIIQRQVEKVVENYIISDGFNHELIKVEENNNFNKGLNIATQPTEYGAMPDYIIITNEALKFSFQELADWKTKKGVPSLIITKEEIVLQNEGIDDQEKIRNYLKKVYKYWGPGIFLLIGGDVEIIPSRNYVDNPNVFETTCSDLYFATIDGNWNANGNNIFGEGTYIDNIDNIDFEYDFYLGRAPVATVDEVEHFIDKIISYEQLNMGQEDQQYVNNSLFIDAFREKYNCSDPTDYILYGDLLSYFDNYTLEQSMPEYMHNKKWFIFDNPLCQLTDCSYIPADASLCEKGGDCIIGDMELSRINVRDALNSGGGHGYSHIIFHHDHSGPTGMGTSSKFKGESLAINDVKALSNSQYKPFHNIIFSGGCQTTKFYGEEDCIAEEFINNPIGGSVAFMGFAVDVGISGQGYNTMGSPIFFDNFCKALYDLPSSQSLGNNLGIPFQYSTTPRKNDRRIFTLLGDPEMPVWTNTPNLPNPLSVNYSPQTLVTGDNNIIVTINNLPENTIAIACLYKEGEVYSYKYIKGTGSEIEEEFTIQPNTTGNLILTVTAKNFTPIIHNIIVNLNPGINLFVKSCNIDDTNLGNGNGQLDAGETVELEVTISNSGLTNAYNVNAVLSSEYPELEESFELNFPPTNWSIEALTYHWFQSDGTINPPGGGVANGDKLIYFSSSSFSGLEEIIVTPKVFLLNSELRFYMYHDNGFINNDDRLQIKVRLFGTNEWLNIEDALFHRYQAVSGWVEHVVDLSEYNNNEFQIGFQGIAAGGNDIHIDYVRIVSKYILVDPNNNSSSFGDINSGSSAQNLTDYILQASINVPVGNLTPLTFNITSSGNYSSNDEIYLNCKVPEIKMNIIDYITENGDKNIEANEIVSVYFELKNTGQTQATNISGTISNPSWYIEEIIDTDQIFGDIEPFDYVSNADPFTFRTIDFFMTDPEFIIDLSIQDNYGRTWEFNEIDFILPNQVTNLGFTPYPDKIALFWTPDDVKGYNVYRQLNSEWIKLNTAIIEGFAGYSDEYELEGGINYNYKVTSVSNKGFEGPPAYITAYTTWPLHEGFPVTINSLGKRTEGSIISEDVIGQNGINDGKKEIFLTIYGNNDYGDQAGGIIGLYENGEKIFNNLSGFYDYDDGKGSKATPAIADLATNEIFEILVSESPNDWGTQLSSFDPQYGTSNWDHQNFSTNIKGVVVSNIDNSSDGSKEIINFNFSKTNNHPEIFVLNPDGSNYSGNWPKELPGTYDLSYGMPAIGDIDNNGMAEIVICLIDGLYIWKYDGNDYSNENPLISNTDIAAIVAYPDIPLFRLDCPPVIADVNNDNNMELVFMAGGKLNCFIFVANSQGEILTNWGSSNIHKIDVATPFALTGDNEINQWNGFMPGLSVGNIDNDNELEIVVADDELIHAWKSNGEYLPNFPISCATLRMENQVPLLADVDSDSDIEIIVGSYRGKIYAYNNDGTVVFGFPLRIDGMRGTPCISDIDFDGKNEIIASSSKDIYVWDTEGDANRIEWGMYRHDQYNSGVYGNDICNFYAGEDVINGNEATTWGNRRQVKNVRVLNGGQLTITGRIAMPEGSKIIVERGGKLIIDGGTITNACEGLWKGIEVWGNPTRQSTSSYQGWVVIQNEGKIENAEIGVRTVKVVENGGEGLIDLAFAGGIVQTVNANFINNKEAIRFFTYPATGYTHQNTSFINTTHFESNENYIGSSNPTYFVYLNDINKVSFKTCEFINNTEQTYFQSGIYSINSQFYIDGNQTGGSNLNTEFVNLNYGVYAIATNPNRFADIRHTDFDLNFRGLYISGMTLARVTSNNFNTDAPFSPIGGYGMYLNSSTGYTVEDNEYRHEGSGQVGVGIIVSNSGTTPNEIYRNQFYNLTQGISAQENNGNPFVTTGLQILCNDFDICTADVLVPRPRTAGWGIAGNQGSNSSNPTDMAGNLFYIPPGPVNGDYDDINNQGHSIIYFHPINAPGFIDRLIPKDYSTSVTLSPVTVEPNWSVLNGCPPGIEGGGGGGRSSGELKVLIEESESKIDSTESLLSMLVDGGNTFELQEDVEYSFPPEAMAIYTELIDNSPYLSDTVVSTAIEKEEVLPGAMIRDVMVANPHTAKNDELMNKLEERWTPLPEYMKEQILQGKNIVSVKEQTESKLAKFQLDKARAMNTLTRNYRNDTVAGMDSLVALYGSDNDLESKYRLAFLYIEQGAWSTGMATLANIPEEYELSQEENEEYEQMTEYAGLISSLQGVQPDSTVMPELVGIMKSEKGEAFMYALNMLIDLGETEYEEPIEMPDFMKSASVNGSFTSIVNTPAPNSLRVMPNPAKNYIIVEYELEFGGNALIEICDVTSKPIHSVQVTNIKDQLTIDTRYWNKGIYIATLRIDGKTKEYVKFTITN
jgi:hypothetical protein